MNWFRNRSTSFKINSVVLLMAIFLTLVGYVGYSYTKQGNDALNETYNNQLLSVKYVNDARANTRAAEADVVELLLSNDQTDQQVLQKDLETRRGNIDNDLSLYASLATDPYEQERYPKLAPLLEKYRTESNKALEMNSTGDNKAAYAYFNENALPSLNTFNTTLQELADFNAKAAEDKFNNFNQAFATGTKIVIGLPVIAVILALVLGLMIGRMIAKPLKEMQDLMAKAEHGDLTIHSDLNSKDEIGKLSASFNQMVDQIRHFVAVVQQESQSVAVSSEEISASSEQVATGAQSQAEKTQNAAQMMMEITQIAESVAASAHQAAKSAGETAQVTEDGNKIVAQTVHGMEELSGNVLALGERSERIGEIVDVIQGIADQTNLLSLNAAIEAARAGEAGKGFAVVADEVRKLAERTANSTKDISELVKEIQSVTGKAVNSAKEGMTLTQQTGAAFALINEQVNGAARQVNEIAGAAQEAVKTAEQASSEMQSIAAIAEESSASIEQTATAIQSMSELAVNLQEEASKFNI